MKTLCAILLCLPAIATAKPPKEPPLKAKLHAQAIENLKDPDSAKFYDETLRMAEDRDVISLCGSVNSKNSYGGYVGKAGFISTSEGMVIFESSEPGGLFAGAYKTWCARPVGKP